MVDILVLSDTHINRPEDIPPIVLEKAQKVDITIHAGDFTHIEIVDLLEAFGKVVAVHGNMDGSAIRERLPEKQLVKIEGISVGVIHGAGQPDSVELFARAVFKSASIIVCGHSHLPEVTNSDDVLYFNPGSTCNPRFSNPPSIGLLRLDRRNFSAKILSLDGVTLKSMRGAL